MKILYLFALLIISKTVVSQYDITKTCYKQIADSIKVEFINKKKGLLIIYASSKSDSNHFAIVCKRGRQLRSDLLHDDSTYFLNIVRIYEKNMFPDHSLSYELSLYGRTVLIPSEGWASNVYLCPSLDSLKVKPKDKKLKNKRPILTK